VFVVDTNVLLHAANEDDPLFEVCHERLSRWRRSRGAWYLTWGIVYEFMRVITHRAVFPSPWTGGEAWGFIESLLASPGLTVLCATDRHASVAADSIDRVPELHGNLLHDFHTAVLMREHGVSRIYTRDLGFHRFPFLEVLDPTA